MPRSRFSEAFTLHGRPLARIVGRSPNSASSARTEQKRDYDEPRMTTEEANEAIDKARRDLVDVVERAIAEGLGAEPSS